jgi:hypothetical protein
MFIVRFEPMTRNDHPVMVATFTCEICGEELHWDGPRWIETLDIRQHLVDKHDGQRCIKEAWHNGKRLRCRLPIWHSWRSHEQYVDEIVDAGLHRVMKRALLKWPTNGSAYVEGPF